ncbi:hypothetical protein BS17DRAFT_820258 [Gyrodon lividus]|nr:hypothetical protein BS17DRAFT_820258 [Gyrodon lividus]
MLGEVGARRRARQLRVIFGRAIKNEYLTLATLFGTGTAVFASMGGKKDANAANKPLAERVKEAVPIKAESSEEEEFIKNFLAEAEKEGGDDQILDYSHDIHTPRHYQFNHPFFSFATSITFCSTIPTYLTNFTRNRSNDALGEGKERTRSASPSISNFALAEAEHPNGSRSGTITPASASVKAKRRQSSIAYFTPSSPSPWDQRPRPTRTVSGSGHVGTSRIEGTDDDGECVSSTGNRESMGSATSAGPGKRTSLILSTRTNSHKESVCSSDDVGGREREPLTLVEKHADLLHFIAQKERKCLELRDQLAVHERELAELKRKWERIVNRGFPSGGAGGNPPSNSALNAGLGGVALDGLKEGVRIFAAGLSDLGGVIQDPEQNEKGGQVVKPGQRTSMHVQRESDSSASASTGVGSGRISTSSRDEDGGDRTLTVTSWKYELQYAQTRFAGTLEGTFYTSKCLRIAYFGVEFKIDECRSGRAATSASKRVSSTAGVKPAVPVSTPTLTSELASPSSISGLTMGGPVSSWMGSMGKKFGELQKGQTFSKSQKRASVLLADVSHTIASALSPGPTATTPAPLFSPHVQSTSTSTSASPFPASSLSSLRTPPPPRASRTTSKGMESWLDDDEEQTIHAGRVLVPDSKPALIGDAETQAGTTEKPKTVSSFDDDDWNW